MENKHWNKPYSKRAYDLIQGNVDKVNHTNNLYEKQENKMSIWTIKKWCVDVTQLPHSYIFTVYKNGYQEKKFLTKKAAEKFINKKQGE